MGKEEIETIAYVISCFVVAYLITKNWRVFLRDYFAAHAPECPKEWLSRYSVEKGWRGEAKARADWNYEYADEMMKARGQ